MNAPVISRVATSAAALIPSTWTTGSTDVIKTGTWRASLARHIKAPAPCHGACPVNGDIAEWIALARARDFQASWQVLARHNPFPAIAGRICHHPCETACNRAGYDEALSICKLERFVGDQALARGWRFDAVSTMREGHVAIVGGGPSGLSAAYQLRRMGYAVTLYEAQAELGGLMRYGIPAYRLPRDVLDGEIARIVAMGVKVHLKHCIEGADGFKRLREQHDALYLALGAACNKRLPVLDYSQPWVCDGATYLAGANAGKPVALGKRLVVIGGGSAALDAARSARRLGHDVTLLALERRAQMPAQAEEVMEALEEGVTLVDGARLDGAIDGGAEGLTLHCTQVAFVAGAERGQFTLTPVAGSQFKLDADAVVTSIGQDPDLSVLAACRTLVVESENWPQRGQFLPDLQAHSAAMGQKAGEKWTAAVNLQPTIPKSDRLQGAGFAAAGGLLKTDSQMATGAAGIYAGGDMTSTARFVTEAIGMGKRAAQAIARELRQREAGPGAGSSPVPHYDDEPLVPLAAVNIFYHTKEERVRTGLLDPHERLQRNTEVQLGLEIEQALAESERCFSCGTCINCDNCVVYCPDMAVKRVGDGYIVLTDYCKGCGVCVKECPTGSMKMQEELR